MEILVTGGAGFIGSHVCDRLLELGHRVTAADNLTLGRLDNLESAQDHSSFDFVEMDIADENAVDSLFRSRNIECIFHLAANSDIGKSWASPSVDHVNTMGTTLSILEAMRRHAVRQICFASSSAVYGEAQGVLTEAHGPLLPISHYGAAKLASEAWISSYAANYGFRAWIARFPNVVGERSTHGVVYDFVNKLRRDPTRLEVLGDGSQIKPYLHVTDLVDALLTAWETFTESVNLFNVTTADRCAVRRIAELVLDEAGLDAQIVYSGGDRGWIGDVPSVQYGDGRLGDLGWSPRKNSEEAIRAAARWMVGASL